MTTWKEYQVVDAQERHLLRRLAQGPIDGCNRNTFPTISLLHKGLAFDGRVFISITPLGEEILERTS